MIVGYRKPVMSFTAAAGSLFNPLFLSSTDELQDNDPQSVTRLAFDANYLDSPPSLFSGGFIELRCEFDRTDRHRYVGLLGVTPPTNLSGAVVNNLVVGVRFRRPADVNYDYTPTGMSNWFQALTPGVSGKSSIWWLFPEDMEQVAGMAFRIYNRRYVNDSNPDGGASASLTSKSYIDIGEVWASPAVDLPIEQKFSFQQIDPTIRRRTLGGRLDKVARTSYRQLDVRLPADTTEVERKGGLLDALDWRTLEARLLQAAPCAVAFQSKVGGVFDKAELNLNAFMAECEPGPTTHVDKTFYTKSLRFTELPS